MFTPACRPLAPGHQWSHGAAVPPSPPALELTVGLFHWMRQSFSCGSRLGPMELAWAGKVESSKSSPWLRHEALSSLKSCLLNFLGFWGLPVAPEVCQPCSGMAELGASILPFCCGGNTGTAISFPIQSGASGVCGITPLPPIRSYSLQS